MGLRGRLLKWCRLIVPLAVAVIAVGLGWLEVQTRKFCWPELWLDKKPQTRVATLNAHAERDPWPCKLGDVQRTASTNNTAPRDLRQPRWSLYLPAISYSSPLVDRFGNIYIATTHGRVISVDPNGEVRWNFKLSGVHPNNPAIQADILFIVDSEGWAYAINTRTGSLYWSRRLASRPSGGNDAVTVGEGIVLFHFHIGDPRPSYTDEAEFIACNPDTGQELWRSRVDSNYFNVIAAFADGGRSLVFTDMNGGTFKMETRTGQLIWNASGFPFPLTPEAKWFGGTGGAPRSHSALALVAGQVVYSGGNPMRHTGRVRALGLATGTELWRYDVDKMLGNNAALAEIDGVPTLVFGAGIPCLHPIPECAKPHQGTVYGLHAISGMLLWRFEVEPWHKDLAAGSHISHRCVEVNMPDAFSSPILDANGTVYIGWHGGIVYALDGRSGALISQFDCAEGPQAGPAVGPSGELILNTGRHLHSFWSQRS